MHEASAADADGAEAEAQLAQLQAQEHDADKLQTKVGRKVAALREKAAALEALHADKKALESSVRDSTTIICHTPDTDGLTCTCAAVMVYT